MSSPTPLAERVNPTPAEPIARARVALAFAVLCVSTGAIFARLAEAAPLAIAAWRMTFATALVLLALRRRWPEWRGLTRSDFALGAGAGLCLAVHFATWISSLQHTTVASSTVLVNTSPLWVALLSPLVTRERTDRRAWLGIGLSFSGAAIMAGSDFRLGGPALFGDALALAGGVAAALYLLLGRRLRARLTLPTYCALTYGWATAALWLVAGLVGVQSVGFTTKTWAALAGMAVIAQIGGHTLYNWSLKHLRTSAVAVALLGEPIGSSLLAWRLFGEVPPSGSLGGALLVLLGICAAASRRD
jgi:drug/metabolite transporter (DMT)-like permease